MSLNKSNKNSKNTDNTDNNNTDINDSENKLLKKAKSKVKNDSDNDSNILPKSKAKPKAKSKNKIESWIAFSKKDLESIYEASLENDDDELSKLIKQGLLNNAEE